MTLVCQFVRWLAQGHTAVRGSTGPGAQAWNAPLQGLKLSGLKRLTPSGTCGPQLSLPLGKCRKRNTAFPFL